jgi:hypothetical protein
MPFDIIVIKQQPKYYFGEKCQLCEIEIGGFYERFAAPIETWPIEKYLEQWESAVNQIVNGVMKAYLVAAMRQPKKTNFIVVYSLYREGYRVFVRNQMILCKGNEKQINTEEVIDLINDREVRNQCEEKISEWETSLEDLECYLQRTQMGRGQSDNCRISKRKSR